MQAATSSKPEGNGGSKSNAGQEVGGELVIAGGDALEILETAEGVLNEVTPPISLLIVADRPFAVATAGDDRRGPGFAQRAAQLVGVVA